nr:thioesterase family protein [Desulfoluna spongiiphila]
MPDPQYREPVPRHATESRMKNHTEIKVRGYHLDLYGHVNNARYLEFIEEARWALFEEHLGNLAAKGYSFFVVNININYKSPATLGDTIEIDSRITRFGGKSCTLKQTMTKKGAGTPVVEADVTFVIAGPEGKALPVEGDIRDMLEPFAA